MTDDCPAVVVSCLPSFRILLSARSTDSAYRRRHPSGSESATKAQFADQRNSSNRLNAIRQGIFLDLEKDDLDPSDLSTIPEIGEPPNTMIRKNTRSESEEKMLAKVPKGNVLVRSDIVCHATLQWC